MKYDKFITKIQEYESNTFSGSGLSRKKAGKIAQKCIEFFVNNRLDGVLLSDFQDEIEGRYDD